MMAIKIGHASIDENGKATGGKVGDQTGKEVCIREWYSKPWNVYLECIDPELADKAANIMECICADNNYGYDQSERLTGYNAIVANKGRIHGAKGEFDCSSLVATCYRLAGLNVSPSCTTRNLRVALLATGKFRAYTDKKYLTSDTYAKRGGIYLAEGSHVVMALEDGSEDTGKAENIYIVKSGDTLSKIAKDLLGNANRYKEIMELNNLKTTVILVGQKLKIPVR